VNLVGPRALEYNNEDVDGTSIRAPGRRLGRIPKRLLALRGDDQLVDRVRDGDDAAFEVIYERHVPGILSFCRHLLADPDEAEDAVQHAFAAAHRELVTGHRELQLKPWLYSVARNRCLSIIRARRAHSEADPEVSTAGLHDEVEQRADLRQMLSDLGDLPTDQRAALVLSELRDLSHAEIAQVLDVPESKVKGMVFRARSGLIERREAREADCEEIRAELAVARRGGLRRGRLRHHLKGCPGCTAYLEEVRSQRRAMLLLLPVVPSVGLKRGVLAAAGIGGGGGAAAGVAIPGAATVAKVAAVALAATGAGVAGHEVVDHQRSDPAPSTAPAVAPAHTREPGTAAPLGQAKGQGATGPAAGRRSEHRAAHRKGRSHAKSRRGRERSATAPGQVKAKRSPAAGRGLGRAKPAPPTSNGNRLGQTRAREAPPSAAPKAEKPQKKLRVTPLEKSKE
jgi:RNA polymerase sigma factor (sigma-70 family)